MSHGQFHPDIEAVLAQVEKDLAANLSASDLRRIRDLFDDATFPPELRSLLARRHSDPQVYEIPNTIMRIMRKAEELRDQRKRIGPRATSWRSGAASG